jgi:hypothetical protein
MPEEDSTLRISKEEKQILETARAAWEKQVDRKITAGEFVRFLAEYYLKGLEKEAKGEKSATGSRLVPLQEMKPAQPQVVAPGPQVSLVTCVGCGKQIGWRVDLGPDGYCPHCGIYLRLMGK